MSKLKAASVHRSGRTARTWNFENDKVDLVQRQGTIELKFSLASKGGGVTDVKVAVGPSGFLAMLEAMVDANRRQTMENMAALLAKEIPRQSDYERTIVRDARQSVLQAAQDAYVAAPDGRDHAERLTRDMVEQLINEINERDDLASGESDAA
jgi:hypothetical protein